MRENSVQKCVLPWPVSMFTGTIRVKICEAQDLRPTDCSKRHNMAFGKNDDMQLMDPYVTIDVDDDTHVAQTTAKAKTLDPVWNELFEHSVENARTMTLTVFHDAVISPDVFVANCSIHFEDLKTTEKEENDLWVSFSHKSFQNLEKVSIRFYVFHWIILPLIIYFDMTFLSVVYKNVS